MQSLLHVRDLSKRFGAYTALDGVSFDVREHEILGLIGPNGSGKTTLIECLLGLLPSDRGDVLHAGRAVAVGQRQQTMFYVPDGITPYSDLYVATTLRFMASIYGVGDDRLAEVVDQLELGPVQRKRVAELSKGYRRRFLLALGLLAPHPVLVLDEPFDGLDLRQAQAAMALLRDLRAHHRTLLLSIHQLTDAERICDRFLLLSAGQILGVGTLDELRQQGGLARGGLEDVFLALT